MKIEREEKQWGVRLVLSPLSDMRIIAEVNHPKAGRRAECRFWFDGVPGDGPIKMTELMLWKGGLQLILDTVKDESAQMAAGNGKRKRA